MEQLRNTKQTFKVQFRNVTTHNFWSDVCDSFESRSVAEQYLAEQVDKNQFQTNTELRVVFESITTVIETSQLKLIEI